MSFEFYPFELHTHTLHSDGKFTPEELAQNAAKVGLYGFALTDHNTATGFPFAKQASNKEELICIHGIEWTTFYGHITVLGGDFDIDWRTINPNTVSANAAKIKDMGGCAGIAHPFRIGYPICTGGSDDWGIEDYKDFTHYEVWSGNNPHKESTNILAEDRYREIAAKGTRLACVYGRDWHSADEGLFAATFLGIEGDITSQKVLQAIKDGKSYVSMGIKVKACLTNGQKTYYIGDSLPAGEYTINVDIFSPQNGFSCNNTFSVQSITLYTEDKAEKIKTINGQYSKYIKLNKGYLQIAVDGSINNNNARLAVATPFYIE